MPPKRRNSVAVATSNSTPASASESKGGWGGNSGESKGIPMPAFLRNTFFPLVLMAVTFPLAFTLVYANETHFLKSGVNGSVLGLVERIVSSKGQFVVEAFNKTMPAFGSQLMWDVLRMLGAFMAFQLALMKLMPGRLHKGPVSPTGHVPVYIANGFQCYIASLSAYLLVVHVFKVVSAAEILRLYPHALATMSVVSLVFCLFLYIKGLYFPSGTDHGSSNNPVMDYYWGTELYPRIFGWDVKVFTNCRFGLMLWALLPIAFMGATVELGCPLTYAQVINTVLQVIYVAKFFAWETGYFSTIDIMHDRAGYYICWGCLVWVPSVYVVHSHYLAHQVLLAHTKNGSFTDFSPVQAALCLLAGVLMIYVNYDADLQRPYVREMDGKCDIWGKPATFIRATYTTEGGQKRSSILVTCGWWGVSRHFHYLPEILASVFWTLPCGFSDAMPWFYVVFLTILLLDRAFRDDARCAAKYGASWDEYKKLVPWRILPGLV